MNDLQINYFLSAAETGSITESARQLYVSPPAVSKQIQVLEAELGFPLFRRTTRGVFLLPEGERMRELFLAQRQQIARLQQDIRTRLAQAPARFRFGLPSDWVPVELLQRLQAFLREHAPNTALFIRGVEAAELLTELESGELDMSLLPIALPAALTFRFQAQPLSSGRRVVLYGRQNPAALAAASLGRQPTLQELGRTPMVITSEHLIENSSAFCVSHGINPVFHIAGDFHSVLQTVTAGVGFTLTDEWCWAADHTGFGRLDMPERTGSTLVWSAANTHPFLDELIRALAAAF